MELRTAFPTAVALGGLLGLALVATHTEPPRIATHVVSSLVEGAAPERVVSFDLPIEHNASTDRFLDLFEQKQQDRMALYLKRSGRYEGMIRSKLRERGMPEDLLYLSMIESGFNPNARSSASAVGLWQFMAQTARNYGLRVDGYVDERRDPEKSTDAALRYMTDLYRQFGAWNLVAAAYNTGENRVARIMREETGSERGQEADFWRIRGRLPRDTREYVPLLYAMAMVGKEPQKYGLTNVERWTPIATDTVEVPAGVDLEVVAKAVGVQEEELKKLNPQLIRGITPPGKTGYAVKVPEGRAALYARNFAAVQQEYRQVAAREQEVKKAKAQVKAKLARGQYQVKRGDSLDRIARRHGTTVTALRRANGLGKRSILQPGQRLKIPA